MGLAQFRSINRISPQTTAESGDYEPSHHHRRNKSEISSISPYNQFKWRVIAKNSLINVDSIRQQVVVVVVSSTPSPHIQINYIDLVKWVVNVYYTIINHLTNRDNLTECN